MCSLFPPRGHPAESALLLLGVRVSSPSPASAPPSSSTELSNALEADCARLLPGRKHEHSAQATRSPSNNQNILY